MLDALIAEARLRWGLDPAAGIAIVVIERLAATPIEPTIPLLILSPGRLHLGLIESATVALPGRHAHGVDPIGTLRRLYPLDHPVGRFGLPDGMTVGDLTADEQKDQLYLRPVVPVADLASPWGMPWLSARLREPDGCPWDREQTHASLRNHLLEEAYEVYDALDAGATPELAGELGDLLLQVVLHAQLGRRGRRVRHDRRLGGDRLQDRPTPPARVRRCGGAHRRPTSIASGSGSRPASVRRLPRAPMTQRATAPRSRAPSTGISRSLPALAASQEMQERAANLGYDWPSIEGVLDKVREEVGELVEAESDAHRAEELGDLLFVLVNVGRKTGIEVEGALRAANEKFRRRFRYVERAAAADDVALRDLSFEQLDALWDAAKAAEREEARS